MDTTKFWWVKTPQKGSQEPTKESLVVPKLNLHNLHSTESLTDILEKESLSHVADDVDVGSIIEEINRVAAQSPLGPYEKSFGERSIDDIMKEAEKIYMESSKSFEQLSQRSRTSQNISDLASSNSKTSTPTPKSISPLPIDPDDNKSDYSSYTEDFSQESKIDSDVSHKGSPKLELLYKESDQIDENRFTLPSTDPKQNTDSPKSKTATSVSLKQNSIKIPLVSSKHSQSDSQVFSNGNKTDNIDPNILEEDNKVIVTAQIQSEYLQPEIQIGEAELLNKRQLEISEARVKDLHQELQFRNHIIKSLEDEKDVLKADIANMKVELENTHLLLEKLKSELNSKVLSSPEINLELERAIEEIKDTREINTSLQLQLDAVNKTHQLLKSSYDDIAASNKILERRVVELDSTLDKYKTELINMQQAKNKLIENEVSLNKLLEIEKLQAKSLKLQNEKDSKCIQDLNRQIKEMERIIARKHPDSVSALIVAAKEDAIDSNLSARKLLEDRIKMLEQEVVTRDSQSSKVFLEIQEKFNQMKNKYESHIEDLELHVSDLKTQLKRKSDTYDVYTQTFFDEKVPKKETFTIGTQTDNVPTKPRNGLAKRTVDKEHIKEDTHLLATIRGLQADLSNKEKVIVKLQKEIEESRKTNRRLQKEREGSLRSISDRKDFRSYPEKLASQSRSESVNDFRKEEELQHLKLERDKLKQQLARLEDDYQSLTKKRLDDLTALQEAHEREVSNYIASITPLREQLELQQVSISTLQMQLTKAKEELAVVNVEKEHLSKQVLNSACIKGGDDSLEIDALMKKVAFLEKRYEEREYRLKGIIQSLAQKNMTNQGCEQCSQRQLELIGYKNELDQLLATVRALK